MTESRPLKFWPVAGDVLTTIEEDGVKAIKHLTDTEVSDLVRYYADISHSQDALDLAAAIERRDQWRKIAHAD